MTPPKTITQIQLEHGLCHCHEAYKSRDMDDPDCPMHSFAVSEAMGVWGEIRAVEFAEWISWFYEIVDGKNGSGLKWEHCDSSRKYTTAELYAIYLKESNQKP